MVEEKGLDIVGIYRVPGNSAAVNALTEQVSAVSWLLEKLLILKFQTFVRSFNFTWP